MILGAPREVGGKDYLAQQARENPTAFLSLLGRLLPKETPGAGGGAVQVDVRGRKEREAFVMEILARKASKVEPDRG